MVAPSAGGIVLVPFPFSDLSQAKLRSDSYARPGKFIASRELMVAQVATLNPEAREQLIEAVGTTAGSRRAPAAADAGRFLSTGESSRPQEDR